MAQLVVCRGTIVGEDKKHDFTDWMKEQGFTVEYQEEFKTLPDVVDGKAVEGTGGRNDLLFSIEDNLEKFAIWRLQFNGEMSWWEDYLDNGGNLIAPNSILEKYERSW